MASLMGADAQSLVLEPGQHALRVGEGVGVPGEVAPLVAAHPEAVEVEDAERMPRSVMPPMKRLTVASSYSVVKEVVSHRPRAHAGGRAERPVRAV